MPIKPTTHVSETGMFMAENPKYREILQRAVEIEERDAQKEHWLGWEWNQVRAHPSGLMKLVIAGIVQVTYKSNRSTMYKLSDRKAVKEALAA